MSLQANLLADSLGRYDLVDLPLDDQAKILGHNCLRCGRPASVDATSHGLGVLCGECWDSLGRSWDKFLEGWLDTGAGENPLRSGFRREAPASDELPWEAAPAVSRALC